MREKRVRIMKIKLTMLSVILFIFCSNCSAENQENNLKKEIASGYWAPEIPESVTFCGEHIDLNNYYLRERFDRELLSFCYWHSQVFLMIKRANKFFPIIEPILKENGVPDDFKYLALIESNLDQRAISPAKAAGLWQLLPTTAKEHGLIVDEDVDERYNVEKSTKAACDYLKRSYQKTGNWITAAAAYNTGLARVVKQIEVQKTSNYFEMLFGEETNRYVFRIILAKFVLENPQKMGFFLKKEDLYYPIKADIVKIDSTVSNLTDFAIEKGINYQLLKDANPWLRTNKITNKERKDLFIKIPTQEYLKNPQKGGVVHNINWVVNP